MTGNSATIRDKISVLRFPAQKRLDNEDKLSDFADMQSDVVDPGFEKIWPLAEALGVSRELFRKYPKQGLPEKLLLPMLELAPEKGIDVSAEELRALTRASLLSTTTRRTG